MLEQFEKLGVVGVRLDHRFNYCSDENVERRSGVLDQRRDLAIDLRNVPLMQRNEDGAFIRKVLVDRSDTYRQR